MTASSRQGGTLSTMAVELPPVMPYADLDTSAVSDLATSSAAADVRRIHVPPLANWRSLSPYLFAGLLGDCVLILIAVIPAFDPTSRFSDVLIPEVAYATTFGLLLLSAFATLHRRLSFQVTPYALRTTTVGLFGVSRTEWPRAQVRKVHLNRIDQKVYLWLGSGDEVSVFLSRDPVASAAAFDALAAALAAVPAAPEGEQLRPPDPSGAMPPSHARTTLLNVGYALAIAALVCLPIAWPLSIVLFVVASVPFGIAMGTQRKEFWT